MRAVAPLSMSQSAMEVIGGEFSWFLGCVEFWCVWLLAFVVKRSVWVVVHVMVGGVDVGVFGKLQLEEFVLYGRYICIQSVEACHIGLTLCIQCLYCCS
jgi:hypothetical protein